MSDTPSLPQSRRAGLPPQLAANLGYGAEVTGNVALASPWRDRCVVNDNTASPLSSSNRSASKRISFRVRAEDEICITAVHEAAHAWAHDAVGLRFDTVSIIPNQARGEFGRVTVRRETLRHEYRNREYTFVEAQVVSLVAGPVAEELFIGARNDAAADGDLSEAHIWASMLYDRHDEKAFIESVRRKTETLLKGHWPSVLAIADGLLLRRRLFAGQVKKIILCSRLPGPGAPCANLEPAGMIPCEMERRRKVRN